MKIMGIKLENFRCYEGVMPIPIRIGDGLTAFIGKNDVGKSTILDALNIFFNGGIDSGDVCVKAKEKIVKISVIFSSFPEKIIIDTEYQTNLKKEYLLNTDGFLEICKSYNFNSGKAKEDIFIFANHPSCQDFDDLHKLKINELKKRLDELGIDKENINLTISAEIRKAIWASRSELKFKPKDILISSGAEIKNIWDQLEKYLPIYALFKSDRTSTDQDDEAQDPMKIAVKEALNLQRTKINEITDAVKQQVFEIANSTIEKIKEMDPQLAENWSPKIELKSLEDRFKITLTGNEEIPLNKRGSGVRRLVLLNFFRAQAEKRCENSNSRSVIYAVEEPETSQHPNYQKMLMRAFLELIQNSECQIIITTHTPMLGSLLPSDSIRYIENCDGKRKIYDGIEGCYDTEIFKKVARTLGVLPDNQIKIFICVEGPSDINFLLKMSSILNAHDPTYENLVELEEKGKVLFFPKGGNLRYWTDRLAPLKRPEFHLFDRDTGNKTKEQEQNAEKINERLNCKALLTKKREIENYLHPLAISSALDIKVEINDEDDVGLIVAKERHKTNRDASKSWDELEPNDQKDKIKQAKMSLNRSCVNEMTYQYLEERDSEGEVKSWMKTIAELMINCKKMELSNE